MNLYLTFLTFLTEKIVNFSYNDFLVVIDESTGTWTRSAKDKDMVYVR